MKFRPIFCGAIGGLAKDQYLSIANYLESNDMRIEMVTQSTGWHWGAAHLHPMGTISISGRQASEADKLIQDPYLKQFSLGILEGSNSKTGNSMITIPRSLYSCYDNFLQQFRRKYGIHEGDERIVDLVTLYGHFNVGVYDTEIGAELFI